MHVQPVPKVSIFMALTTKIVTEKAKNGQKWHDFGHCAKLFHSFMVYVKGASPFGRYMNPLLHV